MKAMSPEVKKVQLQDHSFLLSLTSQGSVYQGYSAAQTIRIGASADDYGCWAAYYQTPSTPFGDVLGYGNKLPEEVAKDLFPEWAKSGLKWRP